jgi:YidC/Oxa1 family membrane protein insertase
VISSFFNTVFNNPIYNALVALISFVPGGDVGIAAILLTIIIRLIILPFSLSAARTQRAMKILEPRMKELKEKHKGNKEKEALETLALYREARVNPFMSIVTVLIQIPILLALYWVFFQESFTTVDAAKIYAFTPIPGSVSLQFLGLISVAGKSIILAALAGATQFFQAHLSLSGTKTLPSTPAERGGFQQIMNMQLKYVFPILIATISYTTSGAVALYFITTNLAGIVQEWYVRRKMSNDESSKLVIPEGAV